MDPVLACIAKVLKFKRPQFEHFKSLWDGTEKSLRRILKELNVSLESRVELLVEVDRAVKCCHKNNIHILWPGHKHYPKGFVHIHQAPLFLTYKGDTELIHQPSISIVGGRSSLLWVEHWLEQELKTVLKDEKRLTISGGARGIDQAVHRLSLRTGLSSVAVLPSGLLSPYPKSLKSFNKYIDSGQLGLMSEYFPWEPMRKHHFYARNRLISAWSPLLFVVQAHRKSGTMITACHAIDQGRSVCALPASPMEEAMHGNLQLLFDGAQMIRWSSDLVSLLGADGSR